MNNLTPMKAVKAECRDCLGDYKIECLSEICYLNAGPYMQRIKRHCAHCSPNWNVDNCAVEDCYLYPFRYGKNPNRIKAGKKRGTDHMRGWRYGNDRV
jgi:hypothetical protein